MPKNQVKKKNHRIAPNKLKLIVVAVVALLVGSAGTYMVTSSSAQVISGTTTNCGSAHGDGPWGNAYVENIEYKNGLKNSDSVRNLAKFMCEKGYLDSTQAISLNNSGNWSTQLSKAINKFELTDTRLVADGIPDAKMICALSEFESSNTKSGVFYTYGWPLPIGFPNNDCYSLLGTSANPYGK